MQRLSKFSKKFRKDLKKIKKSGNKDVHKLRDLVEKLGNGEKLDTSYNDHALKGSWEGYRDCHVEGDWVLIYRIDRNPNGMEMITFEQTGNHSNIFE